jgi:serine/threonine protein kinase
LYNNVQLENGAVDYHFKIADFGLSRVLSPGEKPTPIPYTPNFQHPNLPAGEYGSNADWYSLGCIMDTFTRHMKDAPDPDFCRLLQSLMRGESDVDKALKVAQKKIRGMIWK